MAQKQSRAILPAAGPKGFTLLEVIAVLVLLGILSVAIVSRIVDTKADLAAECEIAKTHLRFVQSRAMNADVPWGIRFDGASYTMITDGVTSTGLLPGESSSTHTLAAGSVSATPGPMVQFNQWGSPGDSDITVTVSDSSSSRSFVVTRKTGGIL